MLHGKFPYTGWFWSEHNNRSVSFLFVCVCLFLQIPSSALESFLPNSVYQETSSLTSAPPSTALQSHQSLIQFLTGSSAFLSLGLCTSFLLYNVTVDSCGWPLCSFKSQISLNRNMDNSSQHSYSTYHVSNIKVLYIHFLTEIYNFNHFLHLPNLCLWQPPICSLYLWGFSPTNKRGYMVFIFWFISLSIMILRSVHVVTNGKISIFVAE